MEGFCRSRAAISIAVGQAIQLMSSLSLSLVQPAGSLFAPGRAVVVLKDHLNKNTAMFCCDQCFGNPWQAELLHSHQHLLIRGLNGCNQPLLEVVTIAPGSLSGDR